MRCLNFSDNFIKVKLGQEFFCLFHGMKFKGFLDTKTRVNVYFNQINVFRISNYPRFYMLIVFNFLPGYGKLRSPDILAISTLIMLY